MSKKRNKSQKAEADFRQEDPEHFIQALIEFLKGDDRSLAIVGSALVEDALEQVLQFHFSADDRVVDELFQPERPLGSFSAKIDVCFVLGIIGQITYGNLLIIKNIRNRFAHKILLLDARHKLQGLTFETQQIAAWCSNLKGIPAAPAKKRFGQVCLLIMVTLIQHIKTATRPKPGKPVMP
jgi:DNA-binding MltR family transcriptional regulator